LISTLFISISFIGCFNPQISQKEKIIGPPTSTNFRYDKVFKRLEKMREIMLDKNANVMIQVESIQNATTGRLQVDIKHFIERPLIEYFRSIKVVAYDPEYELNKQKMMGIRDSVWGDYIITGEISEYGNNIYSEGRELNGDLEFGRGRGFTSLNNNFSSDYSKSYLTVDLKIKNKKGIYDTGSIASNTIFIYQLSKSNEFGFFLNNLGIGISKDISFKQSIDRALRIVSEYSLIQLLGRFDNIPYWKCFEGKLKLKEDPLVIEHWKYFFNNSKNKLLLIKMILKRGYRLGFINMDSNYLNKCEREVLLKIKNYYNIKYSIKSVNFFVELYRHAPIFVRPEFLEDFSCKDK